MEWRFPGGVGGAHGGPRGRQELAGRRHAQAGAVVQQGVAIQAADLQKKNTGLRLSTKPQGKLCAMVPEVL